MNIFHTVYELWPGHRLLYATKTSEDNSKTNKASQAIQSPRTVPFFLMVSLLDGYSFPNVLVKGILAFEH